MIPRAIPAKSAPSRVVRGKARPTGLESKDSLERQCIGIGRVFFEGPSYQPVRVRKSALFMGRLRGHEKPGCVRVHIHSCTRRPDNRHDARGKRRKVYT